MKIFFSLIVLTTLFSCSKKAEIIGKWKLTSFDYSEFLKSLPKEMDGPIEEQMKSQIDQMVNHTFFEFKKDSTLELIYPNEYGMTIKGKWCLSKNSDSLFLKKDDPERFKIEKLTEESLVLSTKEAPQRTLTFKLEK